MIRTSLAACVALAIATMSASADDRPIKIGLLTSFTGPGASSSAMTDRAVAAIDDIDALEEFG